MAGAVTAPVQAASAGEAAALVINNKMMTPANLQDGINAASLPAGNITGIIDGTNLPTSYGTVGQYVFATNSVGAAGATVSGSSIIASATPFNSTYPPHGGRLSGTWRRMGYAPYSSSVTLYQRIL